VTGTTGAVAAPHTAVSSPRKKSPQFTLIWVCWTTCSSAVMTCDHFDVAPQFPSPEADPPAQG